MRDRSKQLSTFLLALGVVLLFAGVGLWAREAVLPAWQVRAADRDGDVIVVAATLDPATLSDADEPWSEDGRLTSIPMQTPRPTAPNAPTITKATAISPRIRTMPVPQSTPTPTPQRPPASSEPPTRLVIPAIALDTGVVPMGWSVTRESDGDTGTEWIIPKGAAGWHENSALPGHSGNTVLSGHNNIYGEVFRDLDDVEPGDTVTLYVDETIYQYIVTEKYIVKEFGVPYEQRLKNAQFIAETDDERLTLVTCWPYETNTHRLILITKPVPLGDKAFIDKHSSS